MRAAAAPFNSYVDVDNPMNEFLTNLSADSSLLWAVFVLGVVAASALALSVVTGLLLRLATVLIAPFGRRNRNKDAAGKNR